MQMPSLWDCACEEEGFSMKTNLEILDIAWEKYCRQHANDIKPCERCQIPLAFKNMDKHYWRKHTLWTLGRSLGLV